MHFTFTSTEVQIKSPDSRIPLAYIDRPAKIGSLGRSRVGRSLSAQGHEVKNTEEFLLLMLAARRIRMGATPGVDAD